MRSSAMPRVSGIRKNAAANCRTIIDEKKANGADFECAAMTGNAPAMRAFKIQCVALPTACPRARTPVGKVSLRETHITAPWEIANDATNQTERPRTDAVEQ